MKPLCERGGERYLKSKPYYPYVGRGYAQLTWDYNYRKAGKLLGVDFIKSPHLLMEARYALPILVTGMKEGWFTTKKLFDYINENRTSFVKARRIVNGNNKADEIAAYGSSYDTRLNGVGYPHRTRQRLPIRHGTNLFLPGTPIPSMSVVAQEPLLTPRRVPMTELDL
jgi:hypothetical protein